MWAQWHFRCAACGARHELPFAHVAPDAAVPGRRFRRTDRLPGEVAGGEHVAAGERFDITARFDVGAVLRLPVLDAGRDLEWVVRAEVSAEGLLALADAQRDELSAEGATPVDAWLASALPAHTRSTAGLPGALVARAAGLPPLLVLAPSLHPLSVEQREGLDVERLREIAMVVRHGAGDLAA